MKKSLLKKNIFCFFILVKGCMIQTCTVITESGSGFLEQKNWIQIHGSVIQKKISINVSTAEEKAGTLRWSEESSRSTVQETCCFFAFNPCRKMYSIRAILQQTHQYIFFSNLNQPFLLLKHQDQWLLLRYLLFMAFNSRL